jgi:hypothetical protein
LREALTSPVDKQRTTGNSGGEPVEDRAKRQIALVSHVKIPNTVIEGQTPWCRYDYIEVAKMVQPQPPNPKFPEQDENGVDLSLIRCNLRLSPTERVRKACMALRSIQHLREQLPAQNRRIFERLKREW